jgi:hypothetical protein
MGQSIQNHSRRDCQHEKWYHQKSKEEMKFEDKAEPQVWDAKENWHSDNHLQPAA